MNKYLLHKPKREIKRYNYRLENVKVKHDANTFKAIYFILSLHKATKNIFDYK